MKYKKTSVETSRKDLTWDIEKDLTGTKKTLEPWERPYVGHRERPYVGHRKRPYVGHRERLRGTIQFAHISISHSFLD